MTLVDGIGVAPTREPDSTDLVPSELEVSGRPADYVDCFPGLYDRAFRVAYRWTGDRDRSTDIAQETMTKTFMRWSHVAPLTYREAWVARVAINVAIAEWRRHEDRGRAYDRVGPNRSDVITDLGADDRLDLARVLAHLSRRQREVVSLRFLEDRSERDVAALLGCSVGSVRQHASRGLARLRDMLGDDRVVGTGPALATSNPDDAQIDAAMRKGRARTTRRRRTTAAAVAILAVVLALFGFAPRNDKSKYAEEKTTTTTSAPTATTADPAIDGLPSAPGAVTDTNRSETDGSASGSTSERGTSGTTPSGRVDDGTAPPAGSGSNGSGSGSGTAPTTAAPSSARTPSPVAGDAPGVAPTTAPVVVANERTFFGSDRPVTDADPDRVATEVGMRFYSDAPGSVVGMRFYKSTANTGTHVGTLWSSSGVALGTVTFTNESASGWQRADFATPVSIRPGVEYTISYHAPNGAYASDWYAFADHAFHSGPLHTYTDGQGGNGRFRYGAHAFPTESFAGTNYWVDVIFVAS